MEDREHLSAGKKSFSRLRGQGARTLQRSRRRWCWQPFDMTRRWASWSCNAICIATLSPSGSGSWLNVPSEVFSSGKDSPPVDLKPLRAKIGQLALEIDLLAVAAPQNGFVKRKRKICREHAFPVKRPSGLVGISRGSVCYLPQAMSAAELALTCRIVELQSPNAYAGSRLFRDLLQHEGDSVGPKHARTLTRRMGI